MDMIHKINKIENNKSCKSCKSCQHAFQNMSVIRQNSRGDGDTLHLFKDMRPDQTPGASTTATDAMMKEIQSLSIMGVGYGDGVKCIR